MSLDRIHRIVADVRTFGILEDLRDRKMVHPCSADDEMNGVIQTKMRFSLSLIG
jgi:hypothetical protein